MAIREVIDQMSDEINKEMQLLQEHYPTASAWIDSLADGGSLLISHMIAKGESSSADMFIYGMLFHKHYGKVGQFHG